MMELRHLHYVLALAAGRKFSRAVERLGVAHLPVSRPIRELEVERFDHTGRPLKLAETDRVFDEQTMRIMAGIEQLR